MRHRRLIPKSANVISTYFHWKFECGMGGSPALKMRGCYAGQSHSKGNFLKSNLTFANTKFIRDVLPVLPGAPKNTFPSLLLIDDNIMS